ncbi:MAG: hypothetical protein IJ350_01905, partial [Clostridia bacterium]|nr:hypothetical protein [Clostridia bacterium]
MQSTFALLESLNVGNLVTNEAAINTYFAEQFASLTPMKVLIALIMGFVVGVVIAFVYKKCYRGVLYSPSFGMT